MTLVWMLENHCYAGIQSYFILMKPSVAKWIKDEVIQRGKKVCFLTAQDIQKHTSQNRIDMPDVWVDRFDMLDIWTQKWTWRMKATELERFSSSSEDHI